MLFLQRHGEPLLVFPSLAIGAITLRVSLQRAPLFSSLSSWLLKMRYASLDFRSFSIIEISDYTFVT